MFKSICIIVHERAFLPEAYAYHDYLIDRGFNCSIISNNSNEILKYDAVFLFYGFYPKWIKYPKTIIGEYHSLSVGRFRRIKDLTKKIFNVKPNFYIFLNEDIRKKILHSNEKNYILRGMGYNKLHFMQHMDEEKIFDIVYCGSMRKGVLERLTHLAELGFSIALVGADIETNHYKIISFGRTSPNNAAKIISQSKYGLNYTPDEYPLNIQDSTKVIEYCAAGIKIITNKYYWINKFEEERKASFLDIKNIKTPDDVFNFKFITPSVNDLEWHKILKKSNLNEMIDQYCSK